MNPNKLLMAKVRAEYFIEMIKILQKKLEEKPFPKNGCKETAACRRASMDLTRSLAELRKPG